MDLVGYSVIFVLAMSSMILALLFMLRVHGGEADRPDNQVGDAGATAGAGDSSKDSPV